MARWSSCALVVLGLAVVSGASLSAQSAAAQPATATASVDAGLAALYARLEQALVAGEPSQILAATSAAATNGDRLSAFAQSQASARAVRAVIRERDRAPLEEAAEGTAYRMLLEVFVEYQGGRAAARTWSIDATRTPADGVWRLADAEALSSADGLNRLALDPNRQFRVRDLAVRAEDLLLTFPSGVAYVASTPDGETGDGRPRRRRDAVHAHSRRWSRRSCASSPARPSCARRSAPPSSAITRSIVTIASAAR